MRFIRSFLAVALVLTVGACAESPTGILAPEGEPSLSVALGEIQIDGVSDHPEYWLVNFSTAQNTAGATLKWQTIAPAVGSSSDHLYKYAVVRYKSDGPGCVEVSLSTTFPNSTTMWRSAAVYVGGITPNCSAVSW